MFRDAFRIPPPEPEGCGDWAFWPVVVLATAWAIARFT